MVQTCDLLRHFSCSLRASEFLEYVGKGTAKNLYAMTYKKNVYAEVDVFMFLFLQVLVQGKQSSGQPASLNVFIPCVSTRVLVPKKASNRFSFKTRLPIRLRVR